MQGYPEQRELIKRPLIRFKKVIIESPYQGDIERNKAYLKVCMLDSIARGEAPCASHKLYTDILDDNILEERTLGIELGFAWLLVADLVAFYTDFGWSNGMSVCLDDIRIKRFRVPYEVRKVQEHVLRSIL
jgi:hypothetical protein